MTKLIIFIIIIGYFAAETGPYVSIQWYARKKRKRVMPSISKLQLFFWLVNWRQQEIMTQAEERENCNHNIFWEGRRKEKKSKHDDPAALRY